MAGLDFLDDNVASAARQLLGCVLEREVDGTIMRGRIVEVEAYDETDAASHSFNGRTKRSDVMFGPPGHLYVYFTYGMHYCCNVVVGKEGNGAAVLIRAIEPIDGEDIMLKNRNGRGGKELVNGPAKICQAMAIDSALNGHDLLQPPLRLIATNHDKRRRIVSSPRIGITKAKDTLWRFTLEKKSDTA